MSLPNIVRKFFGYHTPFIMQNLGTATTVATATFVGRGSEPGATITRTFHLGQGGNELVPNDRYVSEYETIKSYFLERVPERYAP